MEELSSLWANIETAALTALDQFLVYLPNIVGALVLLVVGWLVARLLRALATRAGALLNRGLDPLLRFRNLPRLRLPQPAIEFIANALFWVTVFIFVTAATRVAGLDMFASWLDRVVAYLPRLLAGALIVLAGYLLAVFVRDLVVSAGATADLSQARLLGRLAQAATFLTAVIIGMDQIGLDVAFLVTLFGITVAALGAGFALAFGLGARGLVANLIGAHYLRSVLEPGQRARIGEIEGQVLELSPTAVVLDAPEGRITIPARVVHESPVTVLVPEHDPAESAGG